MREQQELIDEENEQAGEQTSAAPADKEDIDERGEESAKAEGGVQEREAQEAASEGVEARKEEVSKGESRT